jgi:hypothetical protein
MHNQVPQLTTTLVEQGQQ